MDTLRKLTGYSSPGAQQAAAEAAVAEDIDGDVLLEEAGNDGAGLAGALSIRAPISADDADLGDGDGEASFGSGESFNSALERMAASSTVSLEAGSPIGSLQEGGSPLHEHLGHHRHHHHHHHHHHQEHHPLHHDGREGTVVVGNGNGAEEELPVMPVAKLTADDELLEDDETRDDSAEDTVEENGDDGLEYEEAEGGEDVLPSEDEEEVYPRVTAEGLRVRGVEDDYLPEPASSTDEEVRTGSQTSVSEVVDATTELEPESVVEKQPQSLEVERIPEASSNSSGAGDAGAGLPVQSLEADSIQALGKDEETADGDHLQTATKIEPAPSLQRSGSETSQDVGATKEEPGGVVDEAENLEKQPEYLEAGKVPENSPEHGAGRVAVFPSHSDGSESIPVLGRDGEKETPELALPKVEHSVSQNLEVIDATQPELRPEVAVENVEKQPEFLEVEPEAAVDKAEDVEKQPESLHAEPEAAADKDESVEKQLESLHAEPEAAADNDENVEDQAKFLVAEPEVAVDRDENVEKQPKFLKAEPEVAVDRGENVEKQPESLKSEPEVAVDRDENVEKQPKSLKAEPEVAVDRDENVEKQPESVEAEPEAGAVKDENVEKQLESVEAEPVTAVVKDDNVEQPESLKAELEAAVDKDEELEKQPVSFKAEPISSGVEPDAVAETELPQVKSSSSSPALLEEKEAEPQVTDPGATEDIPSQNGLLAGETVDAGPTSEDVLEGILSKTVEAGAERDAGSPFQSDESELIAVLGRDDEENGDWDEDIEEEDEEEDEILIERSAALAALVHAADSSSKGNGDAPSLGAAGPSLPARPAGLGRSVPSLEPAPRTSSTQRGGGAAVSTQPAGPTEEAQPNGEANDGHEETREKLQLIRVKFLRLAHRLGQSAHNVVVAQVLYRLGLAEQLRGGRSTGRSGAFSFDRASAIAEEQEAAGPGELDFTCTIMLLGKTGVGKSATINSIFDEVMTVTNAFSPATRKVQEIIGTVHGIRVRVIDTPGLLPSVSDQRQNEKVMSSVKRFIKKSPPDIVLYFDRLDMQSRDYGDLPLLRTITDTFGPAVWFNAIVVLTHAASAPPDGPNGLPLSYEMFVAQRSHVVQQTIRHAAGDMRLMNPVSLVENHPACRTNRAGQRVLPNGQIWKPQLLLLCFASKILAEANSLLKLQDNAPGRPFGSRQRVPPLPFLLSSLLQSRQQLKMMDDQGGDEDESDDELDEDDNSDDETEFDQLPPFRRLTKEEVLELDDQQRKDYFQELADRERLFQKKQWREELRRRKELKKRMAAAKEQLAEEAAEDEGTRSAAVPVPLPDMVLPPSFDSDSPTHRYRYLEAPNQWLVRPVLETHGWDHDSGYDGFSVEKSFAVNNKFPAQVSGQLTKDKKETNLTLECAASFKHGEGKVTLSGLDIQTIGKDLSYTLRSETRFSNFKQNKTTGGLALTLLGDTIAAGLKLENRLLVGKRLKLVVNGGALTGKGDVAYGGSLEATLRDKDYPFSRTLSTLGLSIMDWHGDLAIGGNLQSQFLLGKTMISARANLNNRGAGQISIRSSSSEQLQMALIGIIPILRAVFSSKLFGSSQPGQ